MKLAGPDPTKPTEFEAGGSSPPAPQIPPQLAEELAEIIAEALVADYLVEVSKTVAVFPSDVRAATAHAETQLTEEITQCLKPTK
jgi:hypothetical protein